MRHPQDITHPIWAVGLMSGTSCDGVDAALIRTDGLSIAETGPAQTVPYPDTFRTQLKQAQAHPTELLRIEQQLTDYHLEAVQTLLHTAGMPAQDIHIIGFHGHTLEHAPQHGRTWQIADAARLATRTGIPVIADLRRHDMAMGGEGAPLVPVYHAALTQLQPKPTAVLNIGGVANITWIGEDGTLLAGDVGPGIGWLDDWVHLHTQEPYDKDGGYAHNGTVHMQTLQRWLQQEFFVQPLPKSLDRQAFTHDLVTSLTLEDGAATIAACTAHAIARVRELLPASAHHWWITGGGRHHPVIMHTLQSLLDTPVQPIDALGIDGDAVEAQAFALLAVRSLRGLPLTFPGTTGVEHPLCGGAYYPAF